MNELNTTYWLIYEAFRYFTNKLYSAMKHDAYAEWKTNNPEPDDGYRCWLCQNPISAKLLFPDPMSFSMDHVIPINTMLMRGLSTELLSDSRNLRPAHKLCNLHKGRAVPKLDELVTLGADGQWLIAQLASKRLAH